MKHNKGQNSRNAEYGYNIFNNQTQQNIDLI